MDRGAWQVTVYRFARVRHDLATKQWLKNSPLGLRNGNNVTITGNNAARKEEIQSFLQLVTQKFITKFRKKIVQKSCYLSTFLSIQNVAMGQVRQSLITRIINRNRQYFVLQPVHDFPQFIHGHLILNRTITHYGCGARDLSGSQSSDNEATFTRLNPWKGLLTLNYSL